MTNSFLAIRTKHQIASSLGAEHVDNLRALAVHLLQPLRDFLGMSIVISSGYRCPAVNKLADGKAHSQHQALRREAAADIYTPGLRSEELFAFVVKNKDCLNYGQVILEADKGVVHLSFKRGRGQELVAL